MSNEPSSNFQQPGEDSPPPNVSVDNGMTPRTKITILIVVFAIIAAGAYFLNRYWIEPVTAQQASSGAHDVADPQGPSRAYPVAPAFTLTDIFGQPLSLNQFRGKVVLLDFWATWCGPCRSEIPGFIQLQKAYASRGFQIIGVSEDQGGVKPVLDFYKELGMNYPVAIDNGKVGELYGGIIGLPTTFLIGRDGRIYSKLPGAVGADDFQPAIETLLGTSAQNEVKNFQPIDGSEPAQVETPAEVNSVVPGIDVTKLSKPDLARYKEALSKQQCSCGCKMTVLECRKTDPGCATSRQMAQDRLQQLGKTKHPI